MRLQCKICGKNKISITYSGNIRDGMVGKETQEIVNMYRCDNCNTIWHDIPKNFKFFYETTEYRRELEGTADINDFYTNHDSENIDKFRITGTGCYRDKIVADVGCGGGGFLDFISNVAKEVVAIEPSEVYRSSMTRRGYTCFPYMDEALKSGYREKVDVLVSFDVIEHVESPVVFVEEAYKLLSSGGVAYIGTPTDAPVMRSVLGDTYESFLFSTQHPWVFSETSLKTISDNLGIKNHEIVYYQRYGLGNFIYWILNKGPGRHHNYDFVSNSMDEHWKRGLEEQHLSDYIVLKITK